MNFASALQGIERARSYLRPVLQIDRTLVSNDGTSISWMNRVAGISRDVYYPLEYQFLLDNSQYSFLLSDASFLQIYYGFDREGQLSAARLAYFPPPIRLNVRGDDFLDAAERFDDGEDPALFEHLFNWYEMIDERRDLPLNTSHVRFDFDPRAASHSKSHLQFGALQDLRIPAAYFPLPLAFIDLVRTCLGGQPVGAADLSHAANNGFLFADPEAIICARLRAAL